MIVIINGTGGAGKDTFIELCKPYFVGDIYSISTVEYIKRIALLLDWKKEKTEKARKFLANLKKASSEYNNFPFTTTVERINNLINNKTDDSFIIFIHSREPKEIEEFVNYFKTSNKTYTLLIKRGDVIDSNESDKNVYNFNYDYIINNNKNIDDFCIEAQKFITEITKE